MRATWIIVPSLLILGACGDPMADIERVSDDTFPQETVVATALPTEAELERKDSILSGLFRKRAEPQEITAPLAAPENIDEPALASLPEESLPDAETLPAEAVVEAKNETSTQDAILATALPTDSQPERKAGLFSDLFRKREQPGDPETLPQNTQEVAPTELASLPEGSQAEPTAPTIESETGWELSEEEKLLVETAAAPENPLPEGDALRAEAVPSNAANPDAATETALAASVEPTPNRKGVLGWLRRTSAKEEVPEKALAPELVSLQGETADPTAPPIEEEQVASLALEPAIAPSEPAAVAPEKRRRLFGRNTPAKAAGMALPDVGLNANLPFGKVARVCNVAMGDLGTRVEQAEARKAGYAIYDSAPDSSAPRSFYVTGFSDSCARQFTASLAVFGTPAFHEQLRYGLPADEYPYSTTDRAYEKVKSKLCGVGRNTPCGERISRLEDTTAFVSVYEHFGQNPRWADMLLHDGALLATAVKTP